MSRAPPIWQFQRMVNTSTTDGLLEVAPGNGWLARESDRIVWLPQSVDIDTAHGCIEPILTATSLEDAIHLIRQWPNPDVAFSLMNIGSPIQVIAHGFNLEHLNGNVRLVKASLRHPPVATAYAIPVATKRVCSPAGSDPVSGMLVEGVIRAGGWRWRPNLDCQDTRKHRGNWDLLGQAGRWEIGTRLTIGRGATPNTRDKSFVSLTDRAVSRRHALLVGGTSGPRIIDSHSRNGTWVVGASGNASAIHDRGEVQLTDGDVILVGKTTFTVRQRSDQLLHSSRVETSGGV